MGLDLPAPAGSKEERYHRVADALVVTLLREGPLALRVATVARRADVSRAWIYKHFGSDTDALLAYAVGLFGDAFAEIGPSTAYEDVDGWRAGIRDATRRGLQDAERAPWCITLWMRYKLHPSTLGEALRDLQQRHLDRFLADMPLGLRKRRDARPFSLAFQAARIGVYHLWLDDQVRSSTEAEALCRPLDDMLDGFVGR